MDNELARLRRYRLLIAVKVDYLPIKTEAASILFQLISGRYEHAYQILKSNQPLTNWGEVFGNHTVATTMINRIV
jgi:DNA replication protein DnaC